MLTEGASHTSVLCNPLVQSMAYALIICLLLEMDLGLYVITRQSCRSWWPFHLQVSKTLLLTMEDDALNSRFCTESWTEVLKKPSRGGFLISILWLRTETHVLLQCTAQICSWLWPCSSKSLSSNSNHGWLLPLLLHQHHKHLPHLGPVA